MWGEKHGQQVGVLAGKAGAIKAHWERYESIKGSGDSCKVNAHLILELYMIATIFTRRCNLTSSSQEAWFKIKYNGIENSSASHEIFSKYCFKKHFSYIHI